MRGVKLEIKAISNGWILKVENYLKLKSTTAGDFEKYFKTFDEVWDYLSKAHPEE